MKVFRHFDIRGEDSMSFDDAQPMAKAFGLTLEELSLIFNEIDINGDGTIQIDEWLEFILKTSNKNFIKRKFVDKLQDTEWVLNLDKIHEDETDGIIHMDGNNQEDLADLVDNDILDKIHQMDDNDNLLNSNVNTGTITSMRSQNVMNDKINSQVTQNALQLINLKTKLTKLLTNSNLDKINEVKEENNDFLNELKDILSDYDSGSDENSSSRSESIERVKENMDNNSNKDSQINSINKPKNITLISKKI